MLRDLKHALLHKWFLLTRPLTLGVRALLISNEQDILLVKPTYSKNWYLPGGGVEVGESCEAALRRELVEEAGIECKSLELLQVIYNHKISKRDHVLIYHIKNYSRTAVHRQNHREIRAVGWFRYNALPENIASESIYAIRSYYSASGRSRAHNECEQISHHSAPSEDIRHGLSFNDEEKFKE